MDAELIAIGTELLSGLADTNSGWLAERLARIGIGVRHVSLVGDDEARIAAVVTTAVERADVVVLTGGLGPTEDDRTRAGLSRALGAPLEPDSEMAARIADMLRGRGHDSSVEPLRQAMRPRGADFLENARGTAPGLGVRWGRALVFALPGVPAEMREMFESAVEPVLRAGDHAVLLGRVLKIAGRGESSVDGRIRDLYRTPHAEVTILARSEGVELLLRTEGATRQEAARRLDSLDEAVAERFPGDLFGRDDETLASVVGAALATRGSTLATTESCTGGLLAATVTDVVGASVWFRGGFVTYADDLKTAIAGVEADRLRQYGAVSGEVARDMARSARKRLAADYGVGITGIAGPTGGTAGKPVGLVYVAVADRSEIVGFRFLLPGSRDLVRRRAVSLALDRLRRRILGVP